MSLTRVSQRDYAHKPLNPEGIQLLRVPLDDSTVDINLRIEDHSRAQAPSYCAVSYTWGAGSKSAPRQVFIDARPHTVTPNTFWCLHYICKYYRQWEYLWIDCICINQKDDVEKSHRVRRMGEVYRDASLVLVWIGSEKEFEKHKWVKRSLQTSLSPYWSRVWIIQELYFAKALLFLYGEESFTSNQMQSQLHDVMTSLSKHTAQFKALILIISAKIDKHTVTLQIEHELRDVISHFLRSQCGDRRD